MNREEEKISIRVELGLFVELSKTIQFYSNCNMTPIPNSINLNRRVVSAALPSMINGFRCPMPTPRIAIRDWDLEGKRTWHIKERMNSLSLRSGLRRRPNFTVGRKTRRGAQKLVR